MASPSNSKPGLPDYILFAPNAMAPTSGNAALTDNTLPHGVAGLIVKLNRDSARHFAGREGTANISIPVETAVTIRFGVRQSGPQRACAEFVLDVRYIAGDGTIFVASGDTNISAYGFEGGETSHGDIRFLVSKPPCDAIRDQINSQGRTAPTEDNLALLEWPTASRASFRLTFIEPGSTLYRKIETCFNNEIQAGYAVGVQEGACWLRTADVP